MQKKVTIHSVQYNFIMNFILTASNFLFPLITFPYVSRVLMSTGNGKIDFAASVANYFLMIANLGIPTYGVRACAQVRDDRDKLTKVAHELFIINMIATLLMVLSFVICIVLIPRFREESTLMYINCINIILNLFGMNWLYKALEQYDYITMRSLLFKVISVILMFALVHNAEDYLVYGAITVFATAGANILNFARVRRYIDLKKKSNYDVKKHLKPIFVLFAQSLAVSIYTNLDTVMLGFMKTDADVGYYNAAVKLKMTLVCLVTSLGTVLLPRMSYYVQKKDDSKFKELFAKALNVTMFMSAPITIYFIVYARESILLLAGEGYLPAVTTMQIIMLCMMPIGITNIVGVQVLTPLEKERYVLYSVIIGAVVDLGLNLLLIPNMGPAGAALATVVAEIAVLIVQMAYAKELMRMIMSQWHIMKYLFLSVVAGSVAFVVKFIPSTNIFVALVCSAGLFFATYVVGLMVTKDEVLVSICDQVKKYGK